MSKEQYRLSQSVEDFCQITGTFSSDSHLHLERFVFTGRAQNTKFPPLEWCNNMAADWHNLLFGGFQSHQLNFGRPRGDNFIFRISRPVKVSHCQSCSRWKTQLAWPHIYMYMNSHTIYSQTLFGSKSREDEISDTKLIKRLPPYGRKKLNAE